VGSQHKVSAAMLLLKIVIGFFFRARQENVFTKFRAYDDHWLYHFFLPTLGREDAFLFDAEGRVTIKKLH